MSKQFNKPLFITLEGIEGAGKSTQIDFISDYLSSQSIDHILTREPGGTQLGEAIRNTLLSTENLDAISDDSELLLMFAARAQHLHEIIKPALDAGKTVICDRYTDSSFAYQGGGRGIDDARIQALQDWLPYDLQADITFLFDLPVDVGLQRAGKRSEADRFEVETIEFFNRAREKYLDIAKVETRVKVIDAEQNIQDIQKIIQTHLESRFV